MTNRRADFIARCLEADTVPGHMTRDQLSGARAYALDVMDDLDAFRFFASLLGEWTQAMVEPTATWADVVAARKAEAARQVAAMSEGLLVDFHDPNKCTRCGGKGRIDGFKHISGGVCFECDGTGRTPDMDMY